MERIVQKWPGVWQNETCDVRKVETIGEIIEEEQGGERRQEMLK